MEFVAPRTPLEKALAAILEEVLQTSDIGINDDFFELGGDSITAVRILEKLQNKMGVTCHTTALHDAPTVSKLGTYLVKNYKDKVHLLYIDLLPAASRPQAEVKVQEKIPPLTQADIEVVDRIVRQSFPEKNTRLSEKKNPPAVFVLSPPRSGSTLFRVMLAGNPAIFSPQELNLLCFNSLGEKRTCGGERFRAIFDDGIIDSIVNLKGCSYEAAREELESYVEQDMSTQAFFRLMQEWADDRVLVDKSPINSAHDQCVERAEEMFEKPLFIHLTRHPHGTIQSYLDYKGHLLMPFDIPLEPRQIGEANWLLSHRNILNGLKNIPLNRQLHVRYEDMVKAPEETMRRVCKLVGIDYDPEMTNPYGERETRMTNAVVSEGLMIGDRNFHQHTGIDPATADRWRKKFTGDFLCEESWDIAQKLGYKRDV